MAIMIIILKELKMIMNTKIKLKLNKSNQNINLIVSKQNNVLFTISTNQIKSKNINILKKILIEKLSEIGIKDIYLLKNDFKYINKKNESN